MRREMMTVVVSAALVFTSCSAPATFLPDSTFENGLGQWRLHRQDGAAAQVTAVEIDGAGGSAAKIVIATNGQPHHIQFACPFESAALAKRDTYCLRFRARSDVRQSFSVQIIGAARPWGNLGLRRELSVSRGWETFSLPFRASEPEQVQAKVDFFFGRAVGAVWIDDIELVVCDERDRPAPRGPVLRSPGCALTFTRGGAVGHWRHLPSGQVLVGAYAFPAAYEVTLREKGREWTVDSTEGRIKLAAGTQGDHAFVFEHPGMDVCCVADCGSDGLLRFDVTVKNRTEAAVTAIRYPIFRCPARLGEDSRDDAILYPRCDGGLIENPLEVMRGIGLADTYPGPLSCQVMAYYDRTAGLYLATHDPYGGVKRFNCRMGIDLELSVTHLFPVLPGEDVELSYPVVAGVFTGDWYDAAEIYRQWSRTQEWCEKTLLEREDTPAWVRRGGLVTPYDPRARKDGERRFDPDGLRGFLAEVKDMSGLPVIANNRGWERYGQWCGQEYFPPYPDEGTFRRDAAIVRERGGQGMIMLSGYRWTIEKPQSDGTVYSSRKRFENEVRPHVTCLDDGVDPYIGTSDKKSDWHGTKWAMMCPDTAFAKKTIVDVARTCVGSGYSVVHFDQVVSGPAASCYCGSSGHGHPPGYGIWMANAMSELLARIRGACAPLDADFALSMEEPNELFLPWLNLCQSRPNGLTSEFPIRRPMTRVVPLFSYLYHDYLVGWVAFYPWRSGGHPAYSLARGFAAGMMPGLHWESLQKWPEAQRRDFARLLLDCCDLYAGEGRDFLVFGKMLKPLKLDVPIRQLNLGQKFGATSVPAVSHSVWEMPDGRRAVVLINPEKADHRVAVPGVGVRVVPPLEALLVPLPRGEP
jgi:hypothetical protein